jgi:hypothetical protein
VQSSRVLRPAWLAPVEASAKSALPLRTRSMQASDSRSLRFSSMPGQALPELGKHRRQPAGRQRGQGRDVHAALAALDVVVQVAEGAPMSPTRRRAEASNRRPSAVSCTLRVSRSNRRVLSSPSSVRISALKAGCDRWQVARPREAALVGQRQKGAQLAQGKVGLGHLFEIQING